MNITSDKVTSLILILTSALLSRTVFFFFDDPEGPNLLIVTVLSIFVYIVSLGVYKLTGQVRQNTIQMFLFIVSTQVLIVTSLYFLLR